MTDKISKTLLVLGLVAAFALGGAAVAGAVQGGSGDSSAAAGTTSTATTQEEDRAAPRQRSDETLLSGDTEAKVREAALAEVEGGTIERVETDGDGNAAYEAHMVKADGTRITVYVNREFEVVGSEEGRGPGPGSSPPDDADSDGDPS
jgi:uncharacterized membrane protein YkoI